AAAAALAVVLRGPPSRVGARSSGTIRASFATPCPGARSNVGLPMSGRGRTDVRRPGPQNALRNTRAFARMARATEDDDARRDPPAAPFPSMMLFASAA